MNENPYENFNGYTGEYPEERAVPDYTPDEYYRQTYQSGAETTEQYGSSGYSNGYSDTTDYSSTAQSQQGQGDVIYSNSYSQDNGYNSYGSSSQGYGQYGSYGTYTQQTYTPPQPPKPKKKKEAKPVTRSTIAVALIVSVVCSSFLGLAGGYFAGKQSGASSGLTINKSEGSGSSYVASNSALSTTEIVEKAADSVVEITTEAVVTGTFSQQYIQEGAGSGVIISKDGYIITNHHVISGASHITVTLRNHDEYTDVKVIGTYEAGDLALLKIKPKKELTSAVIGDSGKLKVGDYAVAIGNPLGQLGGTVTDGIISALDREVTIDGETMNLLQTNAEISPGNSGGGLFDGSGELIGIVNAKSSKEASEGLGFAIPVNDVVDVLSDLKKHGYVKGQIDLGMSISNVNSIAQAWMYGTSQTGVYVTSVNSGSNAAKAGFRAGDIILKVNDTDVSTNNDVNDIIKKLKVGDEVKFYVYRSGSKGTLKMKLQEYTPANGSAQNSDSSGFEDSESPWSIFGY